MRRDRGRGRAGRVLGHALLGVVVIGVSGLVLELGGCSTNREDAPSSCSTGAAHTDDTSFALIAEPSQVSVAAVLPACTPRCAYAAGIEAPSFYRVEALPTGPCAQEGERCAMAVRLRCCGLDRADGPVHGMRCSCAGGVWSCGITSQGGAACPRCTDGSISEAGPTD